MHKRAFIDSSVLLYLYSADEPEKKRRAEATLVPGNSWTSALTLSRLAVILRNDFALDYAEIAAAIQEQGTALQVVPLSVDIIEQGLLLAKKYHYNYEDGIVLATALDQDCSVLYSQTLRSGQRVEKRLAIHNPFVGVAHSTPG